MFNVHNVNTSISVFTFLDSQISIIQHSGMRTNALFSPSGKCACGKKLCFHEESVWLFLLSILPNPDLKRTPNSSSVIIEILGSRERTEKSAPCLLGHKVPHWISSISRLHAGHSSSLASQRPSEQGWQEGISTWRGSNLDVRCLTHTQQYLPFINQATVILLILLHKEKWRLFIPVHLTRC